MAARPTTPASPKNAKIKSPVPGTPLFGCEHMQMLMTRGAEQVSKVVYHYKQALRSIFETVPIIPQTALNVGKQQVTTLTSNYLCLQCDNVILEGDLSRHFGEKKHAFFVDSRNGSIFCQLCMDYIWDPTMEELRLRKIGTGSFTSTRKRKHDELFSDAVKDNPSYITNNTTATNCRATGLRGIYNAGATCYQNVILQTFLHNPILRNFYLSDGHQTGDCGVSQCLSCAMDDIFQEFYSTDTTLGYTAANILSGFWISEKKAFENLVTTKEQDAHEFFQFLAEELHERNGDGRRPESGSEHSCNCIIHQTFYGKLQSTTTCQQCNGVTNQVQSFLDLSLGLEGLAQRRKKALAAAAAKEAANAEGDGAGGDAKPDAKDAKGGPGGRQKVHLPALSLQECLHEEYVKSDKCEYRCHSCDASQTARRHTSIKRLPNVLSIQLKRFEFKHNRPDRAAKIDTAVNFPLQLNMFPYTSRGRASDGKENYELARSCTYDLLSVVVHVGELDTGHYLSYCRVGDQWFVFNDHKVELAALSDVLSAKAYLLFYIIRTLG